MASDEQAPPQSAQQHDEMYALNRHSYESHYKLTYDALGITPRYLVQFPVVLPFHVPFRQGSCYSFELPERDACTIQFGVVSSLHKIEAGIAGPREREIPVHRTRVELTYIIEEGKPPEPIEKDLTQCFDILVAQLNALLVSYSVVTKDHRVSPVAKEMFQWGCIFRIIAVERWLEFQSGIFLMHMGVEFSAPVLDEAVQNRIGTLAWAIRKNKNPFILSEQLSLSARHHLETGNYREAVADAQTSVETFLGVLLSLLLASEGWKQAKIDQHFEDFAFAARLRRDYHPRLGGVWDVERAGTAIADWHLQTYALRNRVVHAGTAPTYAEASAAYRAAVEFRGYVIELLRGKRKKYDQILALLTDPDEPAT